MDNRKTQVANNQRRLRAEKKAQRVKRGKYLIHMDAPHGTLSGYNYWWCRCHECRYAKSFHRNRAISDGLK